jgi:hypothetical protein
LKFRSLVQPEIFTVEKISTAIIDSSAQTIQNGSGFSQ